MRAPVSLALNAGPEALRMIRERGLRAEDVDIVPGAAGGPKWLVLEGLDRFLFGEFFDQRRDRPLHLIGSSVGSWRTACMAMRDPAAAVDRLREGYIEQQYAAKPPPALVTRTISAIIDGLLGETGAERGADPPVGAAARDHGGVPRAGGERAGGGPDAGDGGRGGGKPGEPADAGDAACGA